MGNQEKLIVVRGGGDLASGTIYKLKEAGYDVLVLEIGQPSAIRRAVAYSEAVYDGAKTIEGQTCRLAKDLAEARRILEQGQIALLVDPQAECLSELRPRVVVDAILAKKNLGTTIDMAPLVIGLGPGFTAGVDCHAVIETMRGDSLGKIIRKGQALPDTGTPGIVAGESVRRVIHAPESGILQAVKKIGDYVENGETIAFLRNGDMQYKVTAQLSGVLRGLIREGYDVPKGMKIADIDPRKDQRENCYRFSDKSHCIAQSVLEIIENGRA